MGNANNIVILARTQAKLIIAIKKIEHAAKIGLEKMKLKLSLS